MLQPSAHNFEICIIHPCPGYHQRADHHYAYLHCWTGLWEILALKMMVSHHHAPQSSWRC